MKLTENFTLFEFLQNRWATPSEQKKIIADATPEVTQNITILAKNLQVLRDHLKARITVNVGFRPVWWELKNGRAGTSQHTLGKAADIVVQGYTTQQVADAIKQLQKEGKMASGGVGLYPTFVHYDHRNVNVYW
jgi:uncharacterized protein YcbK (DUF882 family)